MNTVANATRPSSEENQARADRLALAEAMAAIKRQLERKNRPGSTDTSRPTPSSALARVAEAFALTRFETAILVLCAGLELDPSLAKVCATIAGDPTQSGATFGLALAALDGAQWEALAPDRPLRRCRLLSLGPGEVLTQRILTIDERVLHALMGLQTVEPRLHRRLRLLRGEWPLPGSYERSAQELAQMLRTNASAIVHVASEAPRVSVSVAVRAWWLLGKGAAVLHVSHLPSDVVERDELLHLCEREAKLAGLALVVDFEDNSDRRLEQEGLDWVARLAIACVVCARDSAPLLGRPVYRMRLELPSFDEMIAGWHLLLKDLPRPSTDEVARLVANFRLDIDGMRAAAAELAASVPLTTEPARPSKDPATVLWQACRVQARPRLEELAQRIRPLADFERLVIPEAQVRTLRAIAGQVKFKAKVNFDWGFAQLSDRGLGTAAIFAGPSGTGKTMAAEALALALELDLYRIDLSAVVSKYIGETEENLRRVFDAAEAGGAILLFDEADALFGKRTEVRDSHDRHANIEVSYLLQRMEAYSGLSLLTTNLRKSIDDAFLRRVQFVVEFPFPDAPLRERIWQAMFPAEMPHRDLDFAKLAQLSVAGGNIRSIVRNAAYLAAERHQVIDMSHLLEAARLEYSKLARALPPHEVKGWER